MTNKLIAHTTSNQLVLTKLAYGSDKELKNIAANNPAIRIEDKIVVALSSAGIKPIKIKTRF
jgi:hypothetical protein